MNFAPIQIYMRPKSQLLTLIFLTLISCTHKAGTVQPINAPTVIGCDTTNITYYKTIQPIFRTNCYSCHATGVTTGGGLDLEDTTSLKNYLKNGFRGDGIYGSKLYHCLLHTPLAQQMPPTYIIDTCSLKQVHNWLLGGAPIK